MVSALDSRSSAPSSSPSRSTVLRFWARYFTLIVRLFTQVYNWATANLMLKVTLRWTSVPHGRVVGGGGIDILRVASDNRNRDKPGREGKLDLTSYP